MSFWFELFDAGTSSASAIALFATLDRSQLDPMIEQAAVHAKVGGDGRPEALVGLRLIPKQEGLSQIELSKSLSYRPEPDRTYGWSDRTPINCVPSGLNSIRYENAHRRVH